MDSPDIYGVKTIAIGFALGAMAQQARNAFNYWNAKIESPTLQEIIVAFISYHKNTNFYLADCPASFFSFYLEKEKKKKAPCNLFCLLFWASSYN